MQDLSVTAQLLTQLLSGKSPEFGARLKQRLNDSFVSNGYGRFDEKVFGFSRFKDFLVGAHRQLVNVETKEGAADILVSLRNPTNIQVVPNDIVARPRIELPVVRSDVWQAFSNPDLGRKRFFHKITGTLRHFRQSGPSPDRVEVEGAPGDFIEIEPIGGATQISWMRDFLGSIRLSPSEKTAIESLIHEPYTSGVNSTFSRALGTSENGWRHYRTAKVISRISEWSKKCEVPMSSLCVPAKLSRQPLPSGSVTSMHLPPRQQVATLLELLSDEDIIKLVIPTLLSTILIKSRL